jgi:hypothetical protein
MKSGVREWGEWGEEEKKAKNSHLITEQAGYC